MVLVPENLVLSTQSRRRHPLKKARLSARVSGIFFDVEIVRCRKMEEACNSFSRVACFESIFFPCMLGMDTYCYSLLRTCTSSPSHVITRCSVCRVRLYAQPHVVLHGAGVGTCFMTFDVGGCCHFNLVSCLHAFNIFFFMRMQVTPRLDTNVASDR